MNVDEKDPETKEELYGSYDQKTMNAETQAPESRVKTQNAETQTTEFEYLFKQAVLEHDDDRLLSTCQSFRNTFLWNLSLYDVIIDDVILFLKSRFGVVLIFVLFRIECVKRN